MRPENRVFHWLPTRVGSQVIKMGKTKRSNCFFLAVLDACLGCKKPNPPLQLTTNPLRGSASAERQSRYAESARNAQQELWQESSRAKDAECIVKPLVVGQKGKAWQGSNLLLG